VRNQDRYIAIDFKVTIPECTGFSVDIYVGKVSNNTPPPLLASTGECGKRPLIFRVITIPIKKTS
jgi:hypothetical protein